MCSFAEYTIWEIKSMIAINIKAVILSVTLIVGLFASVAVIAQSSNKAELKSVLNVDLKRYAGKWFEIAKYPNKFQKQCVANTTATYTEKKNGRIEVRNECLQKDGKTKTAVGEAKIVDKNTNSKLKVRFAPGALSWLPFVWGNYWIIYLDSEYQYVAIGEPKRDYFWILARSPKIKDSVYADILKKAESMGFNPTKVEKTVQN